MRYKFIDNTKGLAILLIIIGHYFSGIYPNMGKMIYPFHVPVFFIISGIFLGNRLEEPTREYIKSKTKTSLFPYCTSVICMEVILFLENMIIRNDIRFIIKDIIKILACALYGGGAMEEKYLVDSSWAWIGVLWFLSALLGASIVAFIIAKYIRNVMFQLLIIITIFIGTQIFRNIIPFQLPLNIIPAISSAVYVYIGYLLSCKKYLEWNKKEHMFIVVVGFMFWIIAVISDSWPNCSIGQIGSGFFNVLFTLASSTMASLGVLSMMYFFSKYGFVMKVFEKVGRHSLIVMCIHAVEIRVIYWQRIWNKISDIFKCELTFIEQQVVRCFVIYMVLLLIINGQHWRQNHKSKSV